jgi:hypothetical protein
MSGHLPIPGHTTVVRRQRQGAIAVKSPIPQRCAASRS